MTEVISELESRRKHADDASVVYLERLCNPNSTKDLLLTMVCVTSLTVWVQCGCRLQSFEAFSIDFEFLNDPLGGIGTLLLEKPCGICRPKLHATTPYTF